MLSVKKRQSNQNGLGSVLKEAREKAGYSQTALSKELGLEHYTMISQLELGRMTIPARLWVKIADLFRFDKAEWIAKCVLETSPEVYDAAFGTRTVKEVAVYLDALYKEKEVIDRAKPAEDLEEPEEDPEPEGPMPPKGPNKPTVTRPSRYR